MTGNTESSLRQRFDRVPVVPDASSLGANDVRGLRDVVEELQRQEPEPLAQFLEIMRRRGPGRLFVEFSD